MLRNAILILGLAVTFMASGVVYGEEKAKEKTLTDRWYTWEVSGKAVGYYHIVTKQTGDKKAPLLFDYKIGLNLRGRKILVHNRVWTKNDSHYTPLKIEMNWDIGGRKMTFSGKVDWKGTKAGTEGFFAGVAKFGGKERKINQRLADGTVIDFIAYECIRKLPFDAKKVFKFHIFETEDMRAKKDHVVNYKGLVEVKAHGKTVKLHLFVHSGKGSSPSQIYLDDSHQVQRIVIDKRKVITWTTQEKALKAFNGK